MELKKFTCPACSSPLTAAEDKMTCTACGNSFDKSAIEEFFAEEYTAEPASEWAPREESIAEELRLPLYGCKGCGADFYAREDKAPEVCPYCMGKLTICKEKVKLPRPDIIVPFRQSKEDAQRALQKYLRTKPLLPQGYFSSAFDELLGVYVPCVIADCTAEGKLRYDGVKKTVSRDSSKESHFVLTRQGRAVFEGITVPVSLLSESIFSSLLPYDFHSNDYDIKTLADYVTERVEADSSRDISRAERVAADGFRKLISDTVSGYDPVTERSGVVDIKDGKTKLALVPLWIFRKKVKGKVYLFAMNAQSGKFFSSLPTSKGRAALLAAIITAVTAIAGSVLSLLL